MGSTEISYTSVTQHKTNSEMSSGGNMERTAASFLCDKSDPNILTSSEIKDGWDSCTNFMRSYGLKPYDSDDRQQALEISRGIKKGRLDEQSGEDSGSSKK